MITHLSLSSFSPFFPLLIIHKQFLVVPSQRPQDLHAFPLGGGQQDRQKEQERVEHEQIPGPAGEAVRRRRGTFSSSGDTFINCVSTSFLGKQMGEYCSAQWNQ